MTTYITLVHIDTKHVVAGLLEAQSSADAQAPDTEQRDLHQVRAPPIREYTDPYP